MKIICLIEALGSGGAERQLTGLAALLKHDGFDVKVVTYFPKDFYKYVLDEAGVEYHLLFNAQGKIKRVYKMMHAIIKYHADVIIAYSPAAAEIACLMKLFGYGVKVIVSERNTTIINNRSEKIKFYLYKWADFIVPNSHMQEKFIEDNYPHLSPKTRVITNFVDTDYFSPGNDYSSSEVCKIICVGRDNPQKNILVFIDSLKILVERNKNFHVDWYGSFETSYGKECQDRIEKYKLEGYITLCGESRNVRDEYRKHDVFCIPSIYEGFPNVLCEAMSCGLPVICSNVCDNPTIVQVGVNGLLFDPNSAEDMANSIEAMILMPVSEKKKISAANRERSISMFSKDAFLAKYKRLF